MDLTHEFSVPTSIDETWAHFQDVATVAECFPGATVASVESGDGADSFTGSCKVKLGPIALLYQGSGTFVERDEAAHRFVVEAKGKDKRGNGTAGAHVTLTMAEAGSGTDVKVVTDLAITGKPAQFGRGVMQDVSDKLLGQFVDCLEQRLAGGAAESAENPAAASGGAHAADTSAGSPSGGPVATPAGSGAPSAEPVETPSPAAPPRDDALDMGATVLPVLAKTYGKQVLAVVAGLAGLLVLRRLLRHRD